ncbi:unnamed protein product [Rhodiola kirilowii]
MTIRDSNETTLLISGPLESLSLMQSPSELLDSPAQSPANIVLTEDSSLKRKKTRAEAGENAAAQLQNGWWGFRGSTGTLVSFTDAFQKFIGQPVSISCSSRTDSGVHALSNVFHVDIERVSKRRPGEVVFLSLAVGPGYISKFEKERAWHVHSELDISAMQKASKVLVGTHDFSSFRAAGCQANSPIRTLDELNVTEVSPSPYFPTIQEREQSSTILSPNSSDAQFNSGLQNIEAPKCQSGENFGVRRMHRCYIVTARGRSFLYHQVRLLVGVLKCVGTGHLTVADVESIIKAKDVTAASPMAPACGLYLGSVGYDLSEEAA